MILYVIIIRKKNKIYYFKILFLSKSSLKTFQLQIKLVKSQYLNYEGNF